MVRFGFSQLMGFDDLHDHVYNRFSQLVPLIRMQLANSKGTTCFPQVDKAMQFRVSSIFAHALMLEGAIAGVSFSVTIYDVLKGFENSSC